MSFCFTFYEMKCKQEDHEGFGHHSGKRMVIFWLARQKIEDIAAAVCVFTCLCVKHNAKVNIK